MSDWIPDGEAKLVDMCRRWANVLSSEEARILYKWDTGLCDAALVKVERYLGAVDAFANVDSSENRTAKNEAKTEAVNAIRGFAASSVRNSPFVDTATREALGLRTPDAVHTVHPRPTAMPNTVVEPTKYPLQHRVQAMNFDTGGRGKPAGVNGVRFVWQVGGERPVNGAAMLRGQFSRRTDIVVLHDETDRGKPVWYASCYENARGETGPWSLVADAYIG